MTSQSFLFFLLLLFAMSRESSQALTQAEKDEFLQQHNTFRAGVNPTAPDMLKMEWDDKLATLAQSWAERCTFSHPNRKVFTQYAGLGQNLAMDSSTPYSARKQVTMWHDEVAYYTYSSNACSDVCGHYTQVVWATSYKLGCGKHHCASVTNTTLKGAFDVTACQYSPPGNYYGSKPYKQGTSCSACPKTHPYSDNNLCSKTSGSSTRALHDLTAFLLVFVSIILKQW